MLLGLPAYTSGFLLDCAPLLEWELLEDWTVLFLSLSLFTLGLSQFLAIVKCLINVCGKYGSISVLIEIYTKYSRNCEERELIFHIEQSWGQGKNGQRLGENLQGEGGKHCSLLRILTKQHRKDASCVYSC